MTLTKHQRKLYRCAKKAAKRSPVPVSYVLALLRTACGPKNQWVNRGRE